MMFCMKHAWFFLVVLGWALVGCSNVVGPEEFLYTYRAGAESGAAVSPGGAVYAGRDESGDYHMLKLRSGTPSEQFFNVTDKERILRCRADRLPADFPRGFQPLGTESYESSEDTRNYVQLYLQRSADRPAKRPEQKTIAGNEWTDTN